VTHHLAQVGVTTRGVDHARWSPAVGETGAFADHASAGGSSTRQENSAIEYVDDPGDGQEGIGLPAAGLARKARQRFPARPLSLAGQFPASRFPTLAMPAGVSRGGVPWAGFHSRGRFALSGWPNLCHIPQKFPRGTGSLTPLGDTGSIPLPHGTDPSVTQRPELAGSRTRNGAAPNQLLRSTLSVLVSVPTRIVSRVPETSPVGGDS